MVKDSSYMLSRPFLGMNSHDLRFELAQLITKVDLLLNNIEKGSEKIQTEDIHQKTNKKLSSAELAEFVKSSKTNNNSDGSEISALTGGTSEFTTLNNETKPASIYTSSLGQNSSQPNDYPASAPRPQVPVANNYQNQSSNNHNSLPQHNSSSQQNGYLPNSKTYPQPPVNQQPTHIYPSYPPNNSSQLPNQNPPNGSQSYTQRPPSINSQTYGQPMYPPRLVGNSGSGYPNPNVSYSYSNAYPSAPGGPYQQ